MMEIEDRDREYKQYVKSILPELADYDDRSNDKGYGGGSSLGSDSSRREELMKEIAKAKKLVTEKHLLSPRLEKALIADAKGDKETGSMEPGEGSAVRGSHLPQESILRRTFKECHCRN